MKATLTFLLFLVAAAGAAPKITFYGNGGLAPNPYNLITDDNGVDIADTPSVTTATEFGAVRLGALKNQFFRVQNIGDSTLTITR